MDIDAAISVIESSITSGKIYKQRIEIDGQSVQFFSMKDQVALYESLLARKNQSDATSPYARGRVVIGDMGDGSR